MSGFWIPDFCGTSLITNPDVVILEPALSFGSHEIFYEVAVVSFPSPTFLLLRGRELRLRVLRHVVSEFLREVWISTLAKIGEPFFIDSHLFVVVVLGIGEGSELRFFQIAHWHAHHHLDVSGLGHSWDDNFFFTTKNDLQDACL